MSDTNENNNPTPLREELEDRLADLALSEVLGGRHPPDLSQAVLAAPRQSHRSWRSMTKLALAASLLIAISAGGYGWWFSRSPVKQVSLADPKFSGVSSASSSEIEEYRLQLGSKFAVPMPANETWADHYGEGVAEPDVLRRARFDVAAPPPALNPTATATGGRLFRSTNNFATVLDGVSSTTFVGEKGVNEFDTTRSDVRYSTSSGRGGESGEQEVMLLVTPRIIILDPDGKAQQGVAEKLPNTNTGKPDEGRGPGEGGDRYSRIVENPFLKATDNPLSTFSIDVDTASYAKVRRFLMQNGMLPPPDAVRIEELVNYFHYDYPPPKDDKPFAAHVEVAACPWAAEASAGADRPEGTRDRSRGTAGQQPGVSARRLRLDGAGRQAAAGATLACGCWSSSSARTTAWRSSSTPAPRAWRLPSTPGYRKDEILTALDNLHAGGSTNGGAGIHLAYDLAADHFIKGGTNRVILCTDGDFNVGITSDRASWCG